MVRQWKNAIGWMAAALMICAVYFVCLKYWFPGYFSPISPFHGDFYEHASLHAKSLSQVLRYPRPVSYLAMKVLGWNGLRSVIAGGIAVALVNVLLTVVLVKHVTGVESRFLVVAVGIYCALLFTQPNFYFEHRHDLPAEVSYLFAMISLIGWGFFLEHRRGAAAALLLAMTVCAAVLFAFAKETYFATVPCLVVGMAWIDRKNRKWHGALLASLMALEAFSFYWNAHLNGPFVNMNAGLDNTYRIDFSPGAVIQTSRYYFGHFFTPWMLLVLGWAMWGMRRSGRLMAAAATFLLAGVAALGPHAVLPQHLSEDYSWVGAKLILAPVLMTAYGALWPGTVVLVGLAGLTIFGPISYRDGYRSPDMVFQLEQDRVGVPLAHSVTRLHQIPKGSRVLVVGLEATFVPFYTESFLLAEFGDKISWTVLTGPGIPPRKANRVTRLVTADSVNLSNYDWLATYNSEGALASLRQVASLTDTERGSTYILVPALQPAAEQTAMFPREAYRKYIAADICLNWGLLPEARKFLDEAAEVGGSGDATYRQLRARLESGLKEVVERPKEEITLVARPARIVDASGLGETELLWTVVPARACEIRVLAPDGKIFARSNGSGSAKTAKWVRNGMTFYLQDVSGGKKPGPENTLAQITIEVTAR